MSEDRKSILAKIFQKADELKAVLLETGYDRCEVDINNDVRVYEEYRNLSLFPNTDIEIEKSNAYVKKNIPSELRWAVWERDNFTCQICGSRKKLTVDHIHPEVKGGEATMENCQTLCKSCNSRKGAR